MGDGFMAGAAEALYRQEAASWKRRALLAEGRLHGHRRLRLLAEEVLRAICERDSAAKSAAIDELGAELASLDIVDQPRDVFSQKIQIGLDHIEIRTRAGLGQVSTLDLAKGLIEIDGLQPTEGKLIGLVFQALQFADIATGIREGTGQKLDRGYLHSFVVPFLMLALELGIIAVSDVTAASLEAYVGSVVDLAKREAASIEG